MKPIERIPIVEQVMNNLNELIKERPIPVGEKCLRSGTYAKCSASDALLCVRPTA